MAHKLGVGYGNPPKHSQFKKGKSGNPKGRPKGSKNLKTDLEEELQEKIHIKEAGTTKSVSKQRAVVKAMLSKALSGDVKAANMLMALLLKLIPEKESDPSEADLTPTDLQILADFEASIVTKVKSKKGKSHGKQS